MTLTKIYTCNINGLKTRIIELRNNFAENNRIINYENNNNGIPFTKGLKNYGNTCFINSILQCIFSLQQVVSYIMDSKVYYLSILTSDEYNLFESLVNICYKNFDYKTSQFEINNALNTFLIQFYQYFKEQFTLNNQDDANNFLTAILSYIDDCFGEFDMIINNELNDYDIEKFIFINKHFGLEISTVNTCIDCGNQSSISENPQMLILNILKKNSICESLESYFGKELMKDSNNLWNCSRCKEFRISSRQVFLNNLPKYLIIYLKRFEFQVYIINSLFFKNYLISLY